MGKKHTVAVFGATGKVGGAFVEMALSAGHNVCALVRDRSRFVHAEHPQVEVFEGDATDPDDVLKTVSGTDVVVSCLGNVKSGGTVVLIMDKATECIMSAASAQENPPRCLMISSIGVGGSSWLIKAMLTLIGGRASFQDYERAEARVRDETSVPRVVIRPYALNDKPAAGKFKVLGTPAHFGKPIPRPDVAHFFMGALDDTQWDGSSGVNIGGA